MRGNHRIFFIIRFTVFKHVVGLRLLDGKSDMCPAWLTLASDRLRQHFRCINHKIYKIYLLLAFQQRQLMTSEHITALT